MAVRSATSSALVNSASLMTPGAGKMRATMAATLSALLRRFSRAMRPRSWVTAVLTTLSGIRSSLSW